ncbi:MAG: amino acid adenylation domain-containing protein, partial [bacterium]|nr:amino acid adenylation domain-containing protein [bacterium]
FNHTKKELVRDKCYHLLFEEQVEKNPLKTAVIYNEQHITYRALNEEADTIARFLSAHRLNNNTITGLYMKRCITMLASIIGIFKAGGAYMPIAVDYPETRIKYILQNSEVNILVTGGENEPMVNKIHDTLPLLAHVLYLDYNRKAGNGLQEYPARSPGLDINTDNLAYMIYTSGTTGNPKGVLIHQLGMLNHIYAKIHDLEITGDDIIAQTAPACFDISVWQFLAGLLVGGATFIIDREVVFEPGIFLRVLREGRISILESVPSLMTVFLDTLEYERDVALKHLRWMILTGEPLTLRLVHQWCRHYPGIKLLNAYGPTEASDDVTHHVVNGPPPGIRGSVPIGKPLQNLHIYILDRHLSLCPIGVRGEICVAGIGVGKGYWKDAEKTERSFIPNPFLDKIGDMDFKDLYKTGDIGYFRPDGTIECLGRLDQQVKIRGNRVELGEIEAQLLAHREVKDVLVTTGENEDGY